MFELALNKVSKSYLSKNGSVVQAVEDVSIDLEQGRITCLVGPTGCGKTTILRLAAGLDEPDSGRIVFANNSQAQGASTGTGYLTQRHTLLPWLTARDNVGLPFKVSGISNGKSGSRVSGILQSLGLVDFADLYPHELSGGMQQRAAIGRLLAMDSRCWLMDEPFSALDERTRHHLQNLLIELNQTGGITVMFVTHSIDEAVYLADVIHVLSTGPGRIAASFEIEEEKPRDRLSPAFGRRMEEVRMKLEQVISG